MRSRSEPTLRRSQLARWHKAHGALIEPHADLSIVTSYPNEATEGPGLCDLSLLPRTGLKGRGAPELLKSLLADIPTQPNHALVTADGLVIAKLSNEEFLLLGPLNFDARQVTDIETATLASINLAAYPLPRADSHCLFALVGDTGATAMAKLCAVDLRAKKFLPGAIAQTSIASVNGIVISREFNKEPGFYILCDVASAEYLWKALIDAIEEFGGSAVGVQRITPLDQS